VNDVEDFEEGDADVAFDAEEPKTAQFSGKQLVNVTREYGLGFWFKFQGPQFSSNDPEDAQRFLATASMTRDYRDVESHALYMGVTRTRFMFETYSTDSNQRVNGLHRQPNGLEGRWVFFYFSYSDNQRQAVGFTLFQESNSKDSRVQKISFDVAHHKLRYIKFIFGGHFNGVPNAQGRFANVVFGVGKGRFISKGDFVIHWATKKTRIPDTQLTVA
jgi:hypothetical protein